MVIEGEQDSIGLGEPLGAGWKRNVKSFPHAKSLTPEGRLLLKGLSTGDPSAILKEYLDNDNANAEIIRLCLEEHSSRLSKVPRKPRLEMMRSEGFDNLVLGWIKSDLPSDAASLADKSIENRWRGALLRSLINAHLMLEYRPSADAALKVYFKVSNELAAKRNANKETGTLDSGYISTSLWPSTIKLASALQSGRYPKTNAKLYQHVLQSLEAETWKGDSALRIARLHLHHPAAPNPEPMWSLLQQHFGGKTQAEMLEQTMASGTRAKVNLLYAMQATERLLRLQDRPSDAKWVSKKQSELLAGTDEVTRKLFEWHRNSPEQAWQVKSEATTRPALRGESQQSVIRRYMV
ncbi:hypothetical protein LTR17_019829 [Elasticomyces elasticus]|nr:hypothetical protein LTR17_019829 [Elasticomyces elasticus]